MKRYIPNTITCCNLISGCTASLLAFNGQAEWALLWICIGCAFDFCDGLSARLLGVSSPIGKELDSLADDITFGFAPSAIIFNMLQQVTDSFYLPFVAFIMAAFSALRLAKFNLDTRQTTSFIGLPTPANAVYWGSVAVGYGDTIETLPYAEWIIIALMLLSCYLLVCELPMFAMKFKHWGIHDGDNMMKYGFVIFSLACMAGAATGGKLSTFVASFAVIVVMYVLVSLVIRLTKKSSDC